MKSLNKLRDYSLSLSLTHTQRITHSVPEPHPRRLGILLTQGKYGSIFLLHTGSIYTFVVYIYSYIYVYIYVERRTAIMFRVRLLDYTV